MTTETSKAGASFIVRIWQEPGSPLGWRGQLVEVQGQTVHYFEDFEGLMALLHRSIQASLFTTKPPYKKGK